MMLIQTPKDALPWVGMYVAGASLACTLAMAADAFQGFRQRKLWFPNRFFTLNAASITLISIAMKLPVDLTTDMSSHIDLNSKYVSSYFLVTMLANILPSLGFMGDRELLLNMVAWGMLVITIMVNLWIQSFIMVQAASFLFSSLLIFSLLWFFSVALTVPASRRILEHKYKEMHELASYGQDMKFSSKDLVHNVTKYWMMAETGNPQFALAYSKVSSAFGVICSVVAFHSVVLLYVMFHRGPCLGNKKSDYKWSIDVIIIVQLVGVVVGSIAPVFRCLTSVSYFNLSKKLSKNHLNVFRVEKQWIQRLHVWKHSHVSTQIPGHYCKIVFHFFKNMILNFCITLQVMVVVTCKTICLPPILLLILLSSCWYICKSLLRRFKKEPNASRINVRSEIEEYTSYMLLIEDEIKLSRGVLKTTLNSITRVLHVSEKKTPENLMKLLKRSTGFGGVVDFDSDLVPPLDSEDIQNSWSLVAVTLTAVAIALPNIEDAHVKWLLVSMKEGIEFVRYIEKSLNANEELVKARKVSRRVGVEVEVYRTWLQIDLQKKARKGKTIKEILRWLGDESVKIMIRFKSNKNECPDHSLQNFIAASCMYRISQTILCHCNRQDNLPTDEEIFEWVSTILADILYACLTNLPRVITMKCHHDEIEKRHDSIRTAAQILGKSKKILKNLNERQLPNLDMDSMAYLDKWHALPKSQILNLSASPNLNESLIVSII